MTTPPQHPPSRQPVSGPPLADNTLLFLTGILMTIGAAMVYSASVTVAGAELDWRRWWATPLRQCVFALAGFLGMLVMSAVGYRWLAWERPRDGWRVGWLYLAAFVSLLAVLVVGREALGARRSLVVLHGPFTLSFQPAELAKVVMVLWLAALLSWLQRRSLDHPERGLGSLRHGFLPAILSVAPLILLTGVEDFGTAALMGVVAMMMLYLAKARWRHMAGAALLGLVGAAVLMLTREHRVRRLLTWWSDAPDPTGDGYQIDQSLLTIASGGWFGRGLGAGVQKYGYLPQKDNDFILATICEELGVVGGLVIVGLFLLWVARGWYLTRRASDPLTRLLAAGLTLLIGLQAAFNVAVVTNSVPTKGISLPFVSAGGSGVLFLGLAAGLLASVARAGPDETCSTRRGSGVVHIRQPG